jgi:primosomal protein N''
VAKSWLAEELIDQWTVQFFSAQNATVDRGTFKTVEQTIQDYLDEKRGTLDRSKESTEF